MALLAGPVAWRMKPPNTHLTIHGERVAAIVPESVVESLRAVEDAEDAAEAEAAMNEPGNSIPLEELEAEFEL